MIIGLFLPMTDRVWRTLESWEWSAATLPALPLLVVAVLIVVAARAPLILSILSIPIMTLVDCC